MTAVRSDRVGEPSFPSGAARARSIGGLAVTEIEQRDGTRGLAPVASDGPCAAEARGRRYMSDALHHRLIVEEPSGDQWSFGEWGRGAGELQCPRGLAAVAGARDDETRIFVCDSLNDRVQVFDGDGMPVFAFGGRGKGPGQFAGPADVAIVTPRLPGDDDHVAVHEPLLAIADEWNDRVQIVRLDGAFVASIGATAPERDRFADLRPETGWPFFRLATDPVLGRPVRLAWREPSLEVTCAGGMAVRFDLAVAMLPSFAAWQRNARARERAHASRYYALLGRRERALPADVLATLGAHVVAA
jgi:hypothetical protein